MYDEIRKVGILFKRDFRMMLTYRLAFFTMLFSMVLPLLYLVLFGSMFGSRDLPILASYGGDFISYILLGAVSWGFLWSIMTATTMSLRNEMEMGTIESIFITPTKPFTLIFAYMLFGLFFGLLPFIIVLSIGALVWNVFIGSITIVTIIVLFLSAMLMIGFGMIFAGLTFWVKKVGETIPLVQNIVMFFSGVFFPITTLPGGLQQVAKFIPFYYPIEGLRKSLIPTTPISEIIGYVFILLVLSITFIVLGIIALNKGINKAKRDGTLAYY